MTATTNNPYVRKVNPPTGKDWRRAADRFIAYTDGTARSHADDVYLTKHKIFALDFRCKSWNRVAALAAAIEAAKVKQAVESKFGVVVEVKFSRTAGCSCGCSPGFVGKIVSFTDADGRSQLSRADVWVEENLTADDLAPVTALAAKLEKGLPAEIAAGNAKAAADKAAKEEQQRRERAEREEARVARDARWAAMDLAMSMDSASL